MPITTFLTGFSVTGLVAGLSSYSVLAIIVGVLIYAKRSRLDLFDVFLEGAAGAVDVTLRIIPYLVGIMVAFGMLRDSGAISFISTLIAPAMQIIGVPVELVPLGLVRPFSGSASNAVLAELMKEYGGDSLLAMTGATIMGSTETTLYLAAVYFGAVGVKHTRHAIAASLLGELAGFLAAVYVCRALLTS